MPEDPTEKDGGTPVGVSHERPAATHFTMVPNIVFALGLSTHALALYFVLCRTAGAGGQCWKGTRLLAQESGMSMGSVSSAKGELEREQPLLGGKPLIAVTLAPAAGAGRHTISVTDIWQENAAHCSTGERSVQPVNAKPAETPPQRSTGERSVQQVNAKPAETPPQRSTGERSVQQVNRRILNKKSTQKEEFEELLPQQTPTSKAKASSLEEVLTYCRSHGILESDGEAIWYKWEGNGWKNGSAKIACWRSTLQNWKRQGFLPSQKQPPASGAPLVSTKNITGGPPAEPAFDWRAAHEALYDFPPAPGVLWSELIPAVQAEILNSQKTPA